MHGQIAGEYGVVTDPMFNVSNKGNPWIKMRLVSKKRKRDEKGNWVDGDPCFVNAMGSGKLAEHLFESVNKGDTILVIGEFAMREYESDGVKKQDYYINIQEAGLSCRWHPVQRKELAPVETARATVESLLGATEAPF